MAGPQPVWTCPVCGVRAELDRPLLLRCPRLGPDEWWMGEHPLGWTRHGGEDRWVCSEACWGAQEIVWQRFWPGVLPKYTP